MEIEVDIENQNQIKYEGKYSDREKLLIRLCRYCKSYIPEEKNTYIEYLKQLWYKNNIVGYILIYEYFGGETNNVSLYAYDNSKNIYYCDYYANQLYYEYTYHDIRSLYTSNFGIFDFDDIINLPTYTVELFYDVSLINIEIQLKKNKVIRGNSTFETHNEFVKKCDEIFYN
jgi:hypothetical protein